jgi:hypothetical protein
VVPDVLSRAHPKIGVVDVTINEKDNWYIKMLSEVSMNPDTYEQWMIEDGKLYKTTDPGQMS